MNRDLIVNVQSEAASKAAYAVIDTLQFHPAQHQIAAMAAVFVLLMDHYSMDIPDMVQAFRNMANDETTGAQDNIRALRMYMEGELK
jgi:hypothetical protein